MADESISEPAPESRREYHRAWRAKHRLRLREYHREYQRKYLADPEKRARRQEQDRTNKKKPIAKQKRRRRRVDLRIKIAGRPKPARCEICDCAGRISFDHCHATGSFRGWLCVRCNTVLGSAKDRPELLRKLADYLERSNGQNPQADFVSTFEVEKLLDR